MNARARRLVNGKKTCHVESAVSEWVYYTPVGFVWETVTNECYVIIIFFFKIGAMEVP